MGRSIPDRSAGRSESDLRAGPVVSESRIESNRDMGLLKDLDQSHVAESGQDLYHFAAELYPICRSITGDGIRRSLALIQKRIPLRMVEVPTGTPVSTGRCPESGISETPISRSLAGSGMWTFCAQPARLNYSSPVPRPCR